VRTSLASAGEEMREMLQRRHRGIYSIRGGRSLCCFPFISQLIGPEVCIPMHEAVSGVA